MKRSSVGETLERFVRSFEGEQDEWADVLDRAGSHRRRLVTAVVVAALVVTGLAVAAPFGLAGKVVGLFRDEGKPVPVASLTPADRGTLVFSMCRRIDLVARVGQPPEKRCLDGEPTIEEIANNGDRLYWKVVFPDGRRCLASGSVRGYREYGGGRSHIGMMGCGQRLLPTPKRPITVDAAFQFGIGDHRPRLLRVSGLAGEGVAAVGLVEKDRDAYKTDVQGRTYVFEQPPNREWIAIAAFDESGDEVYTEPIPPLRAPPRHRPRPRHLPRPRVPLTPLPKEAPIQHAEVAGATIDVYRVGLIAVRFTSRDSQAYRLSRPATLDRDVPISCVNLAYGAGRWAMLGGGVSTDFGPEMRAAVASPPLRGGGGRPPYDGCSVAGRYGKRWNDARGTHDPVEFAFTSLGRRYFAEHAAALDLALFVRTPQMRAIRKAMTTRLPTAQEIAQKFPSRVVALDQRTETAPATNIGIWTNGRDVIVVSRRAEDGRKLFATLRSGRFGPNNLAGLIRLFY